MTFEDMKKIVVDTLNCEEEKVTMEASLTERRGFGRYFCKQLRCPHS